MATPLVCPTDLGPAAKLQTRDDVARALECLVWLNAKADREEADLNRKVGQLQTESADRLKLQVEDQETTVDAYAALLEAELERWGLANQAEFADKKTLAFDHGSLGLRAGSTSIEAIGDQKNLTDRIKAKLAKPIEALLQGLGLLGFWRLKPEPELGEMGKALKAGKLKPADLKKQGFKLVQGNARIEITVGVSTESK